MTVKKTTAKKVAAPAVVAPAETVEPVVAAPVEESFWADVFSLSRAKKAYTSASSAGGVAVAAGLALIFQDGHVEAAEVTIAAGAVVVAFVGTFVTAYTATNAA